MTYTEEKYILLVGEGNFSFAASLASSPNRSYSHKIIATDLKSSRRNLDEYILSNVKTIEANQGLVFLDVDATKLENHPDLQKLKDSIVKIIFNFPHVQTKKMHLGANRKLLRDFFKSVSTFLLPNAQKNPSSHCSTNTDSLQNPINPSRIPVEVSLCRGQSGINDVESKPRKWGDSWQITEQAASANFILTSIKPFASFEEESYVNSGYRDRSSASFNAGEAHTFTFLLREPLYSPQGLSVPVPGYAVPGYPVLIPEPVPVFTSHLFSSLQYLHCSNPLKKAIDCLRLLTKGTGIMDALTMRMEVEPDAVQEPFFHLWVDNLDLDFVLGTFHFLQVIKDPISSREEVSIIPCSKRGTATTATPPPTTTTTTSTTTTTTTTTTDKGVFVGSILGNNMLVFNLSQYVSVEYNLSDSRLLYSQYFKDQGPISSSSNNTSIDPVRLQQLGSGSLYPSEHQYDISFWLNASYSYDFFLQIALEVYGLLLKSVKLLESYTQEIADQSTSNTSSTGSARNKEIRVSHCYRLTIQSLDLALSRNKAIDFHCFFRKVLSNKMDLELR